MQPIRRWNWWKHKNSMKINQFPLLKSFQSIYFHIECISKLKIIWFFVGHFANTVCNQAILLTLIFVDQKPVNGYNVYKQSFHVVFVVVCSPFLPLCSSAFIVARIEICKLHLLEFHQMHIGLMTTQRINIRYLPLVADAILAATKWLFTHSLTHHIKYCPFNKFIDCISKTCSYQRKWAK